MRRWNFLTYAEWCAAELKPPQYTLGWVYEEIQPTTQCKHGAGDCEKCGTSDRRDVVHSARTPNKREMRRLRRKSK